MSDADQADTIRRLERENARLRHLLEQQGVPSTLRHQVRNTLGLMRTILRRSAETKATAEELAAHVEGRFDALLRVETALLSSPDDRLDLWSLVADELLANAIGRSDAITIDGPPVRLPPRRAEMLGLVLHELATNAIKFGAMTAPDGAIEVSWRLSDPDRLVLIWSETGGQPPVDRPKPGFGMEAIQGMLPYQLKTESTVEFSAEGLRCTIALPLSEARPGAQERGVPG